jgi:V8-like Glu-specific endopeptidase
MKTIIAALIIAMFGSFAQAKGKPCVKGGNVLRELANTAEQMEQLSAEANAKDDRVAINDRTTGEYKQLNAVGVLRLPGAKIYEFGSGFLVDACHVLTNNHVVGQKTGVYNKQGIELKKAVDGTKVNFSVGQGSNGNQFSNPDIEGTVLAHGNYNHDDITGNNDWAIVKLSKSMPSNFARIEMYPMASEKMISRDFSTGGFPGARTQNGSDLSKIYVDQKCKVLGMGTYGFLYHTCQVTGGQSGSPLMTKAPNGKYYAVGIVGGDKDYNGMDRNQDTDYANVAVNFESSNNPAKPSSGDKIKAILESDKCD